MSHFPKIPWDEASTASSFADFVADGGTRVRYTKSRGQRIYEATFHPDGDDGSGLNETTELRNWWADCEHGSKASIFVESPGNPGSGGGDTVSIVYPEDPRFFMPQIGPFEREVSLRLVESAPYLELEL